MSPAVNTRKRRRPIAAVVAVAAVLPLVLGGSTAAQATQAAQGVEAVPADPAPPAGQAVPLEALVPGIPPGPHERHTDTPDQALPPLIPKGAADQSDTHDTTVEYVPPQEAQNARQPDESAPCASFTGPYQRELERFLRLPVDGKQSKADCRVIRRWQSEEDIQPAIGFAGPSSWGRIRLIEARRAPNEAGRCPVRDALVACVDLPRQLMWVQAGKDVIFGPVPIRSGKPGYPTRIGWNRIYWRHKNHHSTIYDSPMPFAQFFNGGQAFHGVYGNIYDPTGGSYGCVNLRYDDAKELWDVLAKDDRVYSWGRRPGT
ncbi:L,D-transpeptidase [Streptomyces halobius]|uniref:L,D-transpeptidase n=1 Tax=Streptomyces halobius TaxID=2879846 RepID=A0ABY4M8F7_9ACTN|nr:L,D-transpeptidase [Streptomyces halobius]UQA94017.1 L,D-transpeptidase [Streptomyces halobius]